MFDEILILVFVNCDLSCTCWIDASQTSTEANISLFNS